MEYHVFEYGDSFRRKRIFKNCNFKILSCPPFLTFRGGVGVKYVEKCGYYDSENILFVKKINKNLPNSTALAFKQATRILEIVTISQKFDNNEHLKI